MDCGFQSSVPTLGARRGFFRSKPSGGEVFELLFVTFFGIVGLI